MFDNYGQPLLRGDYKLTDHVGWIAIGSWSVDESAARRINAPGLRGRPPGADKVFTMTMSLDSSVPPSVIGYLFDVINKHSISTSEIAKMECTRDNSYVLKVEFTKASLVAMTIPDTTTPTLQVSYSSFNVTYRKEDKDNTIGPVVYAYPLVTKKG
jgi:hypothetical protein